MVRVALGTALIALSLLAVALPAQAGLIADRLCDPDDTCTYDGPYCAQNVQPLCKTGTPLGFCFLYVEVAVVTVCL